MMPPRTPPAEARPPRRWILPAVVLALFTAAGLSHFAYFWLDDLARAHSHTVLRRFLEEMTGAYAAAVIFLLVVQLVRRRPLTREQWTRQVPLYTGFVVAAGVLHTTLMWGSRVVLFPLVGLGPYDYGIMWYRYPMEFALQAPNTLIMIALLHGWTWFRSSQERELRAAQLRGELDRARLELLQAQLQPHFLFNTLNAISSLMYSDPVRADTMMGRLSDLLRLTFQQSPAPLVSLRDELEWLGWYLELMEVRFGDRLRIERRIDPVVLDTPVPRLLLQPLVENALKHGAGRRAGAATLVIAAGAAGDSLVLSVIDDGPGIPDPAAALRQGVGLTNTVQRLGAIYGDQARFELTNRPEGGLVASVTIPLVVTLHPATAGAS